MLANRNLMRPRFIWSYVLARQEPLLAFRLALSFFLAFCGSSVAFCQEAVSGRGASQSVGRVQVEERPSRAGAKQKGDITFDDLKFDIEKGGLFERKLLTPEIEKLHKQTVRIRGYILPASVFKQAGIEEFVLVRDNMECCFGPGAAIYDCIIVQMEKGKTANFTTRPVAVKGKFEIKEFKYPDSEEHYAIYKMTATEVK